MADKGLILLVDDDPALLAVHSLYLKSLGYKVIEAANGDEALNAVWEQPSPVDAIVSDIVMPEMDGYEFCKTLKSEPATQEIPVIFVSQLDTLEEKMKGFEVGGDDYITKPIRPEVLGEKLKALIGMRGKSLELQLQLAETQSVAMQAMTYSSDLGQVLEFYKSTLNAESFEEVAKLLFEVMANYGLKCTLQIILPHKVLNFGDTHEVSPLEANVIEMARQKGRFFDFGQRTVINYSDFSLLIKNMPIEDEERYGSMKDTLGNLCTAIEAKVKFLLHQSDAEYKEEIVGTVLGVLEKIDDAFSRVQSTNASIISQMIDDLDELMMDLGLSSHQEEQIRTIAVNCRDSSNQAIKDGVALFDMFEDVRTQLDRVLSNN